MSGEQPSALFRTNITLALRGLAILASIVAAIAMGISREDDTKANDISCFVAFMWVHIAVIVYSTSISLLSKASLLWRFVIVVDQVIAFLMATINSATLAMYYLEDKGNSHANWLPICDSVPSYCSRLLTAVSAGFISFGMYMIILLICITLSINPLLIQGPIKEPPPKTQQKSPDTQQKPPV